MRLIDKLSDQAVPLNPLDADANNARETRIKLALVSQRLDAILAEIKRIASSEFAYNAARDALERIRELFEEDKKFLGKLDEGSAPAAVDVLCQTVLTHLHEHLPLLGLILRSTNVRNAFELHPPLVRLARKIIDSSIRVVLSSEWEYSPMIFLEAPSLREFVFIGFPAHESGNPFITPIAGHELGHALWSHGSQSLWRVSFENQLERQITQAISEDEPTRKTFDTLYPDAKGATPQQLAVDLFYRSTWQPAFAWAAKQTEEYFCDLVGLYIFGESFLHAFAYLLRPSFQGERPVEYPNYTRRIALQIRAAAEYGVSVPDGYSDWFTDMTEPSDFEEPKTFLLGLADRASDSVSTALIHHVSSILTLPRTADKTATQSGADSNGKGIENELLDRLVKEFKEGAPPEDSGGLASLLNAAWRVLLSDEPVKGIPADRKEEILRELLLKAIEVLEYKTRIEQANAT